jgi:PUA-domain protein
MFVRQQPKNSNEEVSELSKKLRRHFLKDKKAKRVLLEVSEKLGTDLEQLLESKTSVEMYETEAAEVFLFDGKPLLAKSDGTLFPTLYFEEFFAVAPKIVVDMGAVPYVCKGADVMAPGVRTINGTFEKNAILLVVDERHGKPLAVGTALFNSEEMKTHSSGKIVKILHYVGDKLWNYLKSA